MQRLQPPRVHFFPLPVLAFFSRAWTDSGVLRLNHRPPSPLTVPHLPSVWRPSRISKTPLLISKVLFLMNVLFSHGPQSLTPPPIPLVIRGCGEFLSLVDLFVCYILYNCLLLFFSYSFKVVSRALLCPVVLSPPALPGPASLVPAFLTAVPAPRGLI